MRKILCLIAVALATGCADEAERPVPPETLNERRGVYRQACAAEELAARAAEDIATLEAALESVDPSDPLAEINRVASSAALEFARAYEAHARLREAAYAYVDSAVNFAPTTADSARYLERAATFTLRPPQPGTVEENAVVSYQENLVAILTNADHPCNWDLPF